MSEGQEGDRGYIRLRAASERYVIGIRLLRRLIREGHIPAWRPGGKVIIIPIAGLEAYLKEHPVAAAGGAPTSPRRRNRTAPGAVVATLPGPAGSA